jgi:hypothetical protein
MVSAGEMIYRTKGNNYQFFTGMEYQYFFKVVNTSLERQLYCLSNIILQKRKVNDLFFQYNSIEFMLK